LTSKLFVIFSVPNIFYHHHHHDDGDHGHDSHNDDDDNDDMIIFLFLNEWEIMRFWNDKIGEFK
jgi:hypothetical protein